MKKENKKLNKPTGTVFDMNLEAIPFPKESFPIFLKYTKSPWLSFSLSTSFTRSTSLGLLKNKTT